MNKLIFLSVFVLFIVLAGFISAGIFPIDKPIIIKKNSSFLSLNDSPTDYSGQTGKVAKVNSDENGLEWATDETGAGGTDTNAATECSNGEALFGDGTCAIPTDTNIFSSGISDCSAGDYVYGFNSSGTMDCSTPAGGGTDTNWQTSWGTFDTNMQSTYYPLGSDANLVFGGAGWDNVTTLETCKTHIDDGSNPHLVDINQVIQTSEALNPYSVATLNLNEDNKYFYIDLNAEGSGARWFVVSYDYEPVLEIGKPEVSICSYDVVRSTGWEPTLDNTYDLGFYEQYGSCNRRWRDLYLAGSILGQAATQTLDFNAETGNIKMTGTIQPLTTDNDSNIGTPALRFNTLFIAGYISDGDTNILVADLVGWEDGNATYVRQVDGNVWYNLVTDSNNEARLLYSVIADWNQSVLNSNDWNALGITDDVNSWIDALTWGSSDFNSTYLNAFTDTTLDTNSTASNSWIGTAHTWTANQTFTSDIIANGAITGDNATDITGMNLITADQNITTESATGKAWLAPDTNSVNVGNDSGLVGCIRIVDENVHFGFC